jgi:predicted RNA binding protein YcfA (HicA-like mRNA interferase family)
MKVLKRHGWILDRTHGSHHIFYRPGLPVRISVPCHRGEDLKLGLLKAQMKVAGIKEADI